MGFSKQVTYNTIGNVLSLFCQWLIIMIIPRISDFSEAGIFAVAISICSILNIVATFSLNCYQIADQYVLYSENGYRLTRLVTVCLSFIMIVPFILFFDYSVEQILVVVAYMVYRNLIHLGWLYTATLQIHERLDYVGVATGVEGVLSFMSFTGIYVVTGDLFLSTLVMAAVGGGFFLVATVSGCVRHTGSAAGVDIEGCSELVPLMKIGVPLMLSTIAAIIITALPKLLLQADFGEEITGIFSTLSAPTIIVPTLATSVFAPFIVVYSNIARSGDMSQLRKRYTKLVLFTLIFGASGYVVSVLFAPFFFSMIYGKDILGYMDFFNILMIGITFYAIGMNGSTVLVTKNQGHAVAVSSLLALAVSLVILLIAVPEHGIAGATYGLMISYAVYAVFESICVYLLPLKCKIE